MASPTRQPRASAYVVIGRSSSRPPRLPWPSCSTPAKEIYKGWMFANSAPGLHPFEHPVYDAWLEACTAAAPAP